MKLVFDFFPIIIFFIAYKIAGIYIATGAFIVASAIQMAVYWFIHRRFESIHLIIFFLGVLLGTATLLLHDEMFIKWKPTVIYWIFALAFFATQFFSAKPLIQRMMENNIALPHVVWQKLNLSWGLFFTIMGILNLYVVYHFSTNIWVNFKLFGLLGLTLVFVIIQAILLGKHLKTAGSSA